MVQAQYDRANRPQDETLGSGFWVPGSGSTVARSQGCVSEITKRNIALLLYIDELGAKFLPLLFDL